jgi:Spy/CpxP family protein refolding chaperone
MTSRLIAAVLVLPSLAAGQHWKVGVGGNWWKNSATIERLALTSDQQKRLDDVFQQNRVRLIDQTAALEREEVILEQLMAADSMDAAKVRAGIDRVAEARAQLEKTNANMLLDMRMVLTKQQWDSLKGQRQDEQLKWNVMKGQGIQPKPKRVN